jgi:transcriptional regulator GlxA family with amidase domain
MERKRIGCASSRMRPSSTSAGIPVGTDMALRVLVRGFGEVIARSTARRMEYAHMTDNARRV